MRAFSILFIVSLFVFTSCTKEDVDSFPKLIVHSPQDQSILDKGEAFRIAFDASDDVQLNDVHFVMENLETGEEEIHVHDFINKDEYHFERSFVADEDGEPTYRIKIKVRDSQQNYITEEINLSVH